MPRSWYRRPFLRGLERPVQIVVADRRAVVVLDGDSRTDGGSAQRVRLLLPRRVHRGVGDGDVAACRDSGVGHRHAVIRGLVAGVRGVRLGACESGLRLRLGFGRYCRGCTDRRHGHRANVTPDQEVSGLPVSIAVNRCLSDTLINRWSCRSPPERRMRLARRC